jgi:AcrR family transcriptional regulator
MTSSYDASAAPVREQGLRSRAGNAMARTRAAVLDGASRAVEKHGARKATMADIASLAGIAKGTLYNHFRAKEAVYTAALETGIRSLAAECTASAHEDLVEALTFAAERVGNHPALRRIAADEPAAMASLVTPTDQPLWGLARAGVRDTLSAAGAPTGGAAVDLVLRWVVSFVASPATDAAAQAELLARALAAPPPTAAPDSPTGDGPA